MLKANKMKVIILAGGKGTRLGTQIGTLPKPMVPIGNKPILWHIMKTYSFYGFNEFIICLGTKAEVIKNYFYQYEIINNDFTINIATGDINYHSAHNENNWQVTLVDTGLDTLKGGRIKRVEKYLDQETNFLTYGDGLSNVNIVELLQFHKSHGKIVTITGVQRPSRFGELKESDGQLLAFTEKPHVGGGLINGGYMVFNREMLNHLTADDDCDFEIGPLDDMARHGHVMVYKHQGQWDCMDSERDMIYLNEEWSKGRAFWKVWK
jgi:glucose-1-phosphate cytidylyltransferase